MKTKVIPNHIKSVPEEIWCGDFTQIFWSLSSGAIKHSAICGIMKLAGFTTQESRYSFIRRIEETHGEEVLVVPQWPMARFLPFYFQG
jgi:hypothetical protein